MKWIIGVSLLVWVGCSTEGVESPCDLAEVISGNAESELLRLSSDTEQVCVQLLQQSNSETNKALLQFQFDQGETMLQQQGLSLLYWTVEDGRNKYWANVNSVDYIVTEQSSGEYELNTYNPVDNSRLSGPIALSND